MWLKVICAVLLLAPALFAMFVRGEPVPLERLLKNVGRYVSAHPKDAEGLYLLGRLHALAFAGTATTVNVLERPNQTPVLTDRDEPKLGTPARPVTEQSRAHLREALANYSQAAKLEPENPLYAFSLAWLYEQAAAFAPQIGAPPDLRKASKQDAGSLWLLEALNSYRRAFQLAANRDLRAMPVWGNEISTQAGSAILKILDKLPERAGRGERTRIEAHLAKMSKKPRAITPVIFALQPDVPLSGISDPAASVGFDLSGFSDGRRWPWIRPTAAFLVWDPNRTGRITSGRQLFGSVTWWMFWRDGYQPLAALDDNRDGWLTGTELDGIAVWHDRNSNAVSDASEVTPADQFGIARIAVEPQDGALWRKDGVVLKSGVALASYDWTPTSLVGAALGGRPPKLGLQAVGGHTPDGNPSGWPPLPLHPDRR